MSQERKRSTSRTRVSRPTTPLRPSSRSSFRDSARKGGDAPFPLNAFEPQFGELSDAMADLEANLMHFQLMHESLARFSESFASFLYGLNMNAFCVDFPEASGRPPWPKQRQNSVAATNHLFCGRYRGRCQNRSRGQNRRRRTTRATPRSSSLRRATLTARRPSCKCCSNDHCLPHATRGLT